MDSGVGGLGSLAFVSGSQLSLTSVSFLGDFVSCATSSSAISERGGGAGRIGFFFFLERLDKNVVGDKLRSWELILLSSNFFSFFFFFFLSSLRVRI